MAVRIFRGAESSARAGRTLYEDFPMNQPNTPTPETDALVDQLKGHSWQTSYLGMRDFARDLERRLVEKTAQHAQTRADLKHAYAEWQAQAQLVKQSVAREAETHAAHIKLKIAHDLISSEREESKIERDALAAQSFLPHALAGKMGGREMNAVIVQLWTQADAIELCVQLEAIAPKFGCHVGLTGGTLYKVGERKDCDVLLYRIRQQPMDLPGLWTALCAAGITVQHDFGFCVKAKYGERRIDFLIPETTEGGDYQGPNTNLP